MSITRHKDYVEYRLLGTFHNASLCQAFQDLWSSDEYTRDKAELYDLREVDVAGVSTTGVRSINQLNRKLHAVAQQHPVALLADDVLEHFYSRLVIRLTEDRNPNIRVFRDPDEAVKWVSSEGAHPS